MRMKISNAGERDVAFALDDVRSGYCFSFEGVIYIKSNHFRYGCDAKVKEFACICCEDGSLRWMSETAIVDVVGAELHIGLYE